jgi:hypothetical protein
MKATVTLDEKEIIEAVKMYLANQGWKVVTARIESVPAPEGRHVQRFRSCERH